VDRYPESYLAGLWFCSVSCCGGIGLAGWLFSLDHLSTAFFTTMNIKVLLDELKTHDALCQLSFNQIMSFVTRVAALKRDIMQLQPISVPIDCAPNHLPLSVSQFLSDSVGIPFECMHDCWKMLKDVVWDYPSAEEMKRADADSFKVHGQKRGLSMHMSCLWVRIT
jgi:hypothetical protein